MENKNWLIGLLIAVGGVLLGGWLMHKLKPIPKGMVLVEQSKADSLSAYIAIGDSLKRVANLPPDTIRIDTIIYKENVVYADAEPIHHPDLALLPVRVYTDTLYVENEINAWVKFKVEGHVIDKLQWAYKPIIRETTTTVVKKIPYPILTTTKVYVPSTGNYLSISAGGNDKMFIFGVDYDLVKKDYIYGLQYRRYGEVNIYGIKLGINLNTLFKK